MAMTFAQTLKMLRTSRNLTQEELANRMGTSKQVISRYERGDRNPRITDAKRIADALGVSLSVFYEHAHGIPDDVTAIGAMPHNSVPMIGEIAAGEPIVANRQYEVYVDSPANADFALTIHGDSMNPTYLNGDVIYIRQQDYTDYEGQVCAVILDDEATVKHVYKQETGLLLVSDNPAYPPMLKSYADYSVIRILGKVCGYTRMYTA